MLERLVQRFGRGLSAEQEALLAEHRERAANHVGRLVQAINRADAAAWNRYLGEPDGTRFTATSPWSTDAGKQLLAESPDAAVSTVVMAMANRNLELAVALTRKKLAYTPEDVVLLFALARSVNDPYNLWDALRAPLAAAAALPPEGFTAEVRAAVRGAAQQVDRGDLDRMGTRAYAAAYTHPQAAR